MKLLDEEKIIKVYHHHLFFFIWRSIKDWGASFPFFLVAAMFSPVLPKMTSILMFLGIFLIFLLVNIYDLTMYYLDTLVITNKRLVHLDWINPFRYTETEALLHDIQDIETLENGFLSRFKILDFGTFTVETASTRTVITFDEAPDPEAIKFFLTNISRTHGEFEREKAVSARSEELFNISHKTENSTSKVGINK